VCTLIVIAAVLGDQVGYMVGKFFGPKLFSRPDSRLFKQENLEKAHEFMEKYGPKAIVLARFVPIVRTFAPIVAGAGRMKYRTFFTYNIIGGIAWGTGVTVAGYWLGQIEFIKTNVEAILVLIVVISVVPIVIEYLRERSKKKRAAAETPAAQPHPPVMDDATTQLRRITPDEQPYGDNQGGHPYGDQNQGGYDQQYYGQHPQGQYTQGQHPQGQHPQGQHPQGQYTEGQYTEGQYTEGHYPQGQYPQGEYPQGQGHGQQPYGTQQPPQQGGRHPYNQGY
jgi:membrane-associated protein